MLSDIAMKTWLLNLTKYLPLCVSRRESLMDETDRREEKYFGKPLQTREWLRAIFWGLPKEAPKLFLSVAP